MPGKKQKLQDSNEENRTFKLYQPRLQQPTPRDALFNSISKVDEQDIIASAVLHHPSQYSCAVVQNFSQNMAKLIVTLSSKRNAQIESKSHFAFLKEIEKDPHALAYTKTLLCSDNEVGANPALQKKSANDIWQWVMKIADSKVDQSNIHNHLKIHLWFANMFYKTLFEKTGKYFSELQKKDWAHELVETAFDLFALNKQQRKSKDDGFKLVSECQHQYFPQYNEMDAIRSVRSTQQKKRQFATDGRPGIRTGSFERKHDVQLDCKHGYQKYSGLLQWVSRITKDLKGDTSFRDKCIRLDAPTIAGASGSFARWIAACYLLKINQATHYKEYLAMASCYMVYSSHHSAIEIIQTILKGKCFDDKRVELENGAMLALISPEQQTAARLVEKLKSSSCQSAPRLTRSQSSYTFAELEKEQRNSSDPSEVKNSFAHRRMAR